MKKQLAVISNFTLLLLATSALAQGRWYIFDKQFIAKNFPQDSAFGELHSSKAIPAANPHSTSCGGNDGELHIGIPAESILGGNSKGLPISAPADQSDKGFGIVAEPPNATKALQKMIASLQGKDIAFQGYWRVWNEGHDVGPIYPSNPHHVLELHPAWSFKSGDVESGSPSTVYPMAQYHGYGATKFRPLLKSISADQWPMVGEDDDFVYVRMFKAENFYQLPVLVKSVKQISGGKEALVDVYIDKNHKNLVYSDLSVIVADGTQISL